MKLNIKSIIFFICLFLMSCSNKQDVKQVNFYNKSISVPNYLIPDNSRNRSDFCQGNIYLINHENTTLMSVELCNYAKGKRQNFAKLNLFFEEECDAINDNTKNVKWDDKNSFDRSTYYEYSYSFERDNKYYSVNYLAYEKYYLSIKINSLSKDQVSHLRNFTDIFRDKNFINSIAVSENEIENFCLNCKFPSFW